MAAPRFLQAATRLRLIPADDYRRDAAAHNVLTTVHCEPEWDRPTRWRTLVAQIHDNTAFRQSSRAGSDVPRVSHQAGFPLVRGIRSKPVTAAAPDQMTPGAPGTMQDERWLRGFALLEKYRLSLDLRVPFWHLEEAAEVARTFPNTQIVLNHTGFPWDRSEAGLAAWRRAMAVLASEPNVHVKVSEFGLRDQAWDYESNRRVVLDALAIFGVERCMFATNFPVAGLRIEYGALVGAMRRMLVTSHHNSATGFGRMKAFYRL